MEQNLCGYSKEGITSALKILKDLCEHNICSLCPFGYKGNSCKLQDLAPCDYDIASQEGTWKAFK